MSGLACGESRRCVRVRTRGAYPPPLMMITKQNRPPLLARLRRVTTCGGVGVGGGSTSSAVRWPTYSRGGSTDISLPPGRPSAAAHFFDRFRDLSCTRSVCRAYDFVFPIPRLLIVVVVIIPLYLLCTTTTATHADDRGVASKRPPRSRSRSEVTRRSCVCVCRARGPRVSPQRRRAEL